MMAAYSPPGFWFKPAQPLKWAPLEVVFSPQAKFLGQHCWCHMSIDVTAFQLAKGV